MPQSDQQLLEEMGFEPARATLALKNSGGLQDALTWLESNESKTLEELQQAESNKSATAGASGELGEDGEQTELPGTAASLKCSDCGKLFSTPERAQFHASRTQHENFEESTEVIQPLTEDEKKAKLAELREKLTAKRAAQEIANREEDKKNELIRRKKGAEGDKIKEDLKKKEQMKEVEKRKREKIEDAQAKERVRQQIKETQEARRLQAEREKAAREGRVIEEDKPMAPVKTAPPVTANHSETRLQLRLPNTPPIVKVFPVDSTLFEVAAAVEQEKGFTPTSFTMTFPRKVFQAGTADWGLSLKEAGMVPSCALLVN